MLRRIWERWEHSFSQKYNALPKEGNAIQGCTNRSMVCEMQEVKIPVYLAQLRPQPGYCVQFWAPLFEKDVEKLDRIQGQVKKMMKGWECKPNKERLRALHMFSLEKRGLRGDVIAVFRGMAGQAMVLNCSKADLEQMSGKPLGTARQRNKLPRDCHHRRFSRDWRGILLG